jgi:hypothetical protein
MTQKIIATKKRRKNNNLSFKIIIILLTIVLLVSFFYIYKLSDRTKKIVISLREEKAMILKDLEKSESLLSQTLSYKSVLSDQLMLEQEKVKKLISEIKKNNVDKTKIIRLKKGADTVNERIDVLMNELSHYKKKIDSTTIVLDKEKFLNDTLVSKNKLLSKKITVASKLYYYNLQVIAFKVRNSGEKIETEKARKADLLKVSFSIAENKLINATNNILYVQIIDSKNNVIGSKKTEDFGKNKLTYSFTTHVKYKSKTIKLEEELPVKDLEKGMFHVKVFDKSNIVLQTTVTLL